jgi:hypothetical protein
MQNFNFVQHDVVLGLFKTAISFKHTENNFILQHKLTKLITN